MPKPYCREFADVFSSEALPFPEGLTIQIQSGINGISKSGNSNNIDLVKLYDAFLRLKMRPLHIGLGNHNLDIIIVGH